MWKEEQEDLFDDQVTTSSIQFIGFSQHSDIFLLLPKIEQFLSL